MAPGEGTAYGTFKLIDLGVNYLYSRVVTGERGPDAGYVAPEVVAGEDATTRADLYSVGQLLVTFGGVGTEPDGVVPDGYYSDAPQLARFIEDLTDRDPHHRQLIFPGTYDQLRQYFVDELDAVRVARGDQPPHPRWAEVFMRMGTILPVLLILPATLVERRWWPLLTAVGMTYVFLANWSSYAFARAAINRAHTLRLSTVRGHRTPWLASFAQWTPASLLYAVCVWVIGALIYRGELKDVYFYAGGVAVVNIALWYAIKLGRNLAPIRAELTRACLAAERARHITGP